MRILILIIIFFISSNIFAQNNKDVFDHVGKKYSYKAKTNIYQSQRIKDIINDITYNKSIYDGILGYRIQIFSSSSKTARKNALKLVSTFRLQYKDLNIEPYLKYKDPNFKVRVGDFRTKSEALKALQDIQKKYYNAFIVVDVITPDID